MIGACLYDNVICVHRKRRYQQAMKGHHWTELNKTYVVRCKLFTTFLKTRWDDFILFLDDCWSQFHWGISILRLDTSWSISLLSVRFRRFWAITDLFSDSNNLLDIAVIVHEKSIVWYFLFYLCVLLSKFPEVELKMHPSWSCDTGHTHKYATYIEAQGCDNLFFLRTRCKIVYLYCSYL